MFSKKELSKLTISELKEKATKMNIKYEKDTKKEDLINLILEQQKFNELAEEKKSDLINNPNSQSSFQHHENKSYSNNNFQDIPELPSSYGKNKIVFMVRDPYWGFVYWEITPELKNEHNLNSIDKFLRVYDITTNNTPDNPDYFFDIKINNDANNWYIKFPQPNRNFIIDYGYFENGNFKTLLRSNPAKTPRDNVSNIIDEEWMLTDEQFSLIMKASGADQLFEQIGSQELMKFLAGNVNEDISSNPGSSPTSPFAPFGS